MSMIDQLNQDDINKKNTIILIAFDISILAGFAVTILNKDYSQSIFYGLVLIILISSYMIIRFLVKKPIVFPFIMVIVSYGFIITSIITTGGKLNLVAILFFQLYISTAHLIRLIFSIGFVTGLISLFLNTKFAITEQQQLLHDHLLSILVAYILAGIIALVIIHLSNKQFNQIEDLFLNSEKEAKLKTEEQLRLEQSVEDIVSKITSVNKKIQENINAQTELSKVINEMANGF